MKKKVIACILVIIVIVAVKIGIQEKVVSGEDLISKFGESEITRISLVRFEGNKLASLEPNDIKKFIEVLSNTEFAIIHETEINEKMSHAILMQSDYGDKNLNFKLFGEDKVHLTFDVWEKRTYSQYALTENQEFMEVFKQMIEENIQ